MIWEDMISSLVLAQILLLPMAWKWKINLYLGAIGALIVGIIAGVVVSVINNHLLYFSLPFTVIIELALILLLTSAAILFRFYRDPERIPPEKNNIIISPADGKIIYISPVGKNSCLISTKGNRQFKLDEITSNNWLPRATFIIGIGMNFLNVHVNRSPIEGKVIFQKHIHGRFLSLGKPESEIINERVSLVLDNGTFRVGVVQIASRLVRQIVSFTREGDFLKIGQRIGMIRFGSQVDIAIPDLPALHLNVKPGDIVKGGISILARYDKNGKFN